MPGRAPGQMDPRLWSLIQVYAQRLRLDPYAVAAVSMAEGGGGWGAVGDNGSSFGPFQLHVGGALPAGRGAAWANSPQGVLYAMQRMAASGARGLRGQAAIAAIVRNFERPAAPGPEVQRSLSYYGSLRGSLPLANSNMMWSAPLPGPLSISSGYGQRGGEFHYGIDLPAPLGTQIRAIHNGKVILNGVTQGGGNTIVIQDTQGRQWWYFHMRSPSPVHQGAQVFAGAPIGAVGSTGESTGPHLDIHLKVNGQWQNPTGFVQKAYQAGYNRQAGGGIPMPQQQGPNIRAYMQQMARQLATQQKQFQQQMVSEAARQRQQNLAVSLQAQAKTRADAAAASQSQLGAAQQPVSALENQTAGNLLELNKQKLFNTRTDVLRRAGLAS